MAVGSNRYKTINRLLRMPGRLQDICRRLVSIWATLQPSVCIYIYKHREQLQQTTTIFCSHIYRWTLYIYIYIYIKSVEWGSGRDTTVVWSHSKKKKREKKKMGRREENIQRATKQEHVVQNIREDFFLLLCLSLFFFLRSLGKMNFTIKIYSIVSNWARVSSVDLYIFLCVWIICFREQ